MNVLVLTPVFPPQQGGVEVITKQIAEDLSMLGHKVIVITAAPTPISYNRGLVSVYCLKAPTFMLDPWWSILFFNTHKEYILNKIRDCKIDVVYIPHFDRSYSWACYLKPLIKIPIVSTVYVTIAADKAYCKWKWTVSEPARQLLRILPCKVYDRDSQRAADRIITVARYLKKTIDSIRKDDECTVIPNSVNLEMFNPDTVPLLPVNYTETNKYIVCSGRLSPEKGQIYLIESLPLILKEIPNARICFIGEPVPAYKERLDETAKRLGVSTRIQYMGTMPQVDAARMYRIADVVVQPSLSETFGLSILENMAMGNVVVASDVGGIPELVKNDSNGILVPPEDPEAIAKAVCRVLTDKELRTRISANAISTAQDYDSKKIVKQIEKVMKEVVYQ